MDNLIKELVQIQKVLKAPKNQYNSFGKYKYRNVEDILEAVKPLLPANITTYLTDDMVQVGDRFYVKATAVFTDGTNKVEVNSFAREALAKKGMDESQITGTASSYARKYALNGLYDIDDTKDSDTDEHKIQTSEADKIRLEELVESARNTEELTKIWKENAKQGAWFKTLVANRGKELKKNENA
jgi:hypothetical protein